jgi:hypothetical protein
MPRKPNYSFERVQRERAKTAKQAAKKEARALAKSQPPGEGGDVPIPDEPGTDPAAVPGVRTAEGVENVARVDPERRAAESVEGDARANR